MTDRELLEALEPIALYKAYNGDDWPARQVAPAITALRSRLYKCSPALTECPRCKNDIRQCPIANPQEERKDEPVWIQPDHLQKARIAPFLCRVAPEHMHDFIPLYTHPSRELSKKEMQQVLEEVAESINSFDNIVMTHWPLVARAIERKVRG